MVHGDTSHTLCWGCGTCLRARGPERIAVPGGWTAWGQGEDPSLCAARQGQSEQGTRGRPHCCDRCKRRNNRVRASVKAQDSRACRCKRRDRSNVLDRQRLNTDPRIILVRRTSKICALFFLPSLPVLSLPTHRWGHVHRDLRPQRARIGESLAPEPCTNITPEQREETSRE